DDGEEVLPPRRVADGEIALLDARSAGGRMRTEPRWVDLVREEPSGRAANEEPVLEHRRFLTGPGYARRIGRKLLLACALLAVAGCGGAASRRGEAPPPRPPTGTAAPPARGRADDDCRADRTARGRRDDRRRRAEHGKVDVAARARRDRTPRGLRPRRFPVPRRRAAGLPRRVCAAAPEGGRLRRARGRCRQRL